MGELIVLAEHLAHRSRTRSNARAAFFFELSCPFSYLASERVERELGDVDWIPTASTDRLRPDLVAEAERDARSARLPLVWPDASPLAFPRATRVAAYAATVGRAGAFALAAGRLAFCGGYDLDDPEILADAAAAASVSPDEALAAAGASAWDRLPHATAAGLRRHGVQRFPAVRIGHVYRWGPQALAQARRLRALDVESRALGRG
jgi:2-hydroxychromene-2-carboxylate isomerase